MASGARGIWAIDIGNNSLKALHLRPGDNGPEVIGFDFIEHSRILNQDGVSSGDREEAILETLHKFVEKNEVAKEEFAIAVSGQNSFARFIKLPPVEKKRIPQIVKFEAVQQIPFDINEVEWDWQLTDNPDSPDAEVGIFALKNELISEIMGHFARERLTVSMVQISPMAMYNYAVYDRADIAGSDKATVILDMGTDNTTLVVCKQNSVWQRSIRIGGNTFTEAVAEAFKLDFDKAEKLKRTAMMSKYMRQIFTAMRPVYSDLGSEVQRSLGFYSSSGAGRDKGFSKVVAMGGGTKLQGVSKYLQQTLNVPVIRPESFERLPLASDVSSAKFHENVCDFGIVYGLGVQALSDAKIGVNLLPRKVSRTMMWARKAKYFTAAACLLLGISIISLMNVQLAKGKYNSSSNKERRSRYTQVVAAATKAQDDLTKEIQREAPLKALADKELVLFQYRDLVPRLNQMILACLPNADNTPSQAALYEAFDRHDAATVSSVPRPERKQMFITRMSIAYADSVENATFDASGVRRTAVVSVSSMDPAYMDGRMGGRGGMPGGYPQGRMDRSPYPMGMTPDPSAAGQVQDGGGFVISIEGYSPYKDIRDLLDPSDVKNDASRWGLVTRLENLGKVFPGTDFELYQKANVKHYKLEVGEVDLGDTSTPLGIGVLEQVVRVPVDPLALDRSAYTRGMSPTGRPVMDKVSVEPVLYDPLTREEINKTFSLILQPDIDADPTLSEKDLGRIRLTPYGEPQYIVRDRWFRLSFKLLWKNAPKKTAPSSGYYEESYEPRPPSGTSSEPEKPAVKSPIKRKTRDTGPDF